MTGLPTTAPAFVEMAHRIVWSTVATVGPDGLPRTRVLHPIWEWDGTTLNGWIATGPTPLKRRHLAATPFVSLTYWDPSQDICTADCRAEWRDDDDTRLRIWDLFKHGPAPVGYDPAIIPPWRNGPLSPEFSVLALDPVRLRVFPGSALMGEGGDVLTWSAEGVGR